LQCTVAQEQFQSKSFTFYLTSQWGFLSIGSSLLRPLGSFLNHFERSSAKEETWKVTFSLSLSLSPYGFLLSLRSCLSVFSLPKYLSLSFSHSVLLYIASVYLFSVAFYASNLFNPTFRSFQIFASFMLSSVLNYLFILLVILSIHGTSKSYIITSIWPNFTPRYINVNYPDDFAQYVSKVKQIMIAISFVALNTLPTIQPIVLLFCQ